MVNISVELTFTHIHNNYESTIMTFIKSLWEINLKVIENSLSAQVYGAYEPRDSNCAKGDENHARFSGKRPAVHRN